MFGRRPDFVSSRQLDVFTQNNEFLEVTYGRRGQGTYYWYSLED